MEFGSYLLRYQDCTVTDCVFGCFLTLLYGRLRNSRGENLRGHSRVNVAKFDHFRHFFK